MKEEEIIENNKLIGLFLGATFCNDDKVAYPNGYYMFESEEWMGADYEPEGWCFNSDWNWIMPVVEEIEKLGYRFGISTTFVRVNTCKTNWDDSDEYNCAAFDGKLNATYYAVVEFIKWYNEIMNNTNQ